MKKRILKIAGLTALCCMMSFAIACGSSSANESGDETADAVVNMIVDALESADASGDHRFGRESADASSSASADAASAEKLTSVLTEIRNDVQVGTAGSSLSAAGPTMALLNWSLMTQADDATITETVNAYLDTLSEDELAEFTEQMQTIDDTYQTLMGDDESSRSEYFSDAGVDASNFVLQTTAAYEAVMNAMGLR